MLWTAGHSWRHCPSLSPTISHINAAKLKSFTAFKTNSFGVYLSDYFKSGGSFVYFYFSYSKYLTVKEIAIIFVVIFRVGQQPLITVQFIMHVCWFRSMLFTTNFHQQNYLLSNCEFVMRAYFSTVNVLIFFQRYLQQALIYHFITL